MSSSNSINYSVRLNKSIERKIISDCIGRLRSVLNFDYSYIGFGSLWFTDFIYFHKFLNIKRMFSIERDPVIYERAEYNKPYACIKLIHGESDKEIGNILTELITPAIIWLDYDNNIFDCASFIADVDSIIEQAPNGSILLVTMNVNNSRVRDFKRNQKPEEFSDSWKEKCKELLKQTFGLVDLESIKDTQLTDPKKFIAMANPLFGECITNSIYKFGNQRVFKKIFDFSYADGVEMITQGFVVLDEDKKTSINKLDSLKSPYFLNEAPFRIAAPILTTREKSTIDQELPSPDVEAFIIDNGVFVHDSQEYLKKDKLGFPINASSFRSYAELYKYYPTFTEILTS